MKIVVIIVKIVIPQINSKIEVGEIVVMKAAVSNQRALLMMKMMALMIQTAMIAHLLKNIFQKRK